MRWNSWILVLSAGCASGYGDDLPEGTLCVEVDGEELCAEPDAITAERRPDGFSVRAEITVSGLALGHDRAILGIDATVAGDEVRAFSTWSPIAVDCLATVVHGDHCHSDTLIPMVCPLVSEDAEQIDVRVDRLDDRSVYARFDGRVDEERPPCCVNSCPGWDVPPEVDPSGPYRVHGVAHVAF